MSTSTKLSCPLQMHLRAIELDGFSIIDAIIPPDACDRIRAQLIKVVQRRLVEGPNNDRISFLPGLLNYDQSVAIYLADQRVLALSEALLGPKVRISYTSAIINEPGKPRTQWHADWPFNQNNACHVSAPYPDRIMHLTLLIMISPFTKTNGGTLVVPGSHRNSSNPSDPNLGVDPNTPYPTEFHVSGPAGSAILFDSRLWHCPPANPSDTPRVAVAARYAPWWLNLEMLDPESELRKQFVEEPGLRENQVPRIDRAIYEKLPEPVRPLVRHWVSR